MGRARAVAGGCGRDRLKWCFEFVRNNVRGAIDVLHIGWPFAGVSARRGWRGLRSLFTALAFVDFVWFERTHYHAIFYSQGRGGVLLQASRVVGDKGVHVGFPPSRRAHSCVSSDRPRVWYINA